jgi:predicted DNA binding protein
LPQTADVGAFVEAFREEYPGTSMTSVQRVTRPFQTRRTFYATLEERLTDRQLEALRLAYRSGYFEWPRDSSASDVAESMGVTQPTFNGHLRAGERKLFELLFGS